MWIALVAGCDLFDKIEEVGDVIGGLTNPLVAQGWVLGVEEPQAAELQPLVDAGLLVPGTGVSLFLADAASADQIDEAPIDGAVVVIGTGEGPVEASARTGGLYAIDPGPESPLYEHGATWEASIDVGDGEPHHVPFTLPPPVSLALGPSHTAGAPLDLDLTGQGYHSALIVVVEVTSGQTTYSSEPAGAEDVYEMTSNMDPIGVVTIPGEAFPGTGTYALGIAGMQNDEGDALEGVNTLLSGGMAGQMRFFPLLVP